MIKHFMFGNVPLFGFIIPIRLIVINVVDVDVNAFKFFICIYQFPAIHYIGLLTLLYKSSDWHYID